MIINQSQPQRQYNVPGIGLVVLEAMQNIKSDSDLGRALKKYYPSICLEADKEVVTEEVETKEPQLLNEDPIADAVVETKDEEILEADKYTLKSLSDFSDKDELAEYAKDLEINLVKTKSLKNMYKDLEEAYNK